MAVMIQLAGAVALLLWGIRMVQTGFSRLMGSRLERLLRRSTSNRPRAFATGAVAAFSLQSSTAVILMIAGFSSAGMMTLPMALGTVLGAEVGASLAAFLLNLNVQALALPLVLLGFILFRNQQNRSRKHAGRILIGLGILLLSLSLLGQITNELRGSELFQQITQYVESDAFLAITLMAILTWVIHSTLAAVLILAQFAMDGTVSLETGIFLLLGANLGGAMPALVAGWSLKGDGREVVLGNLLFRLIAVLLGMLALLIGGDRLLELLPSGAMGIVTAHIALNLLNGLVLLACLPLLTPLFEWHSQQGQSGTEISDETDQPMYLALDDINNPARAIANARNEALRIADLVYRMLNYSMDAFKDRELVRQISDLDDDIDRLHREALHYVVSIEESENRKELRHERHEIITFMTNLEHIGDIIDTSLMQLARNKLRDNLVFDAEQTRVIEALHEELVDAFRLSQAVFTSDSAELGKDLLRIKRRYRTRILNARREHLDRLRGHHRENLKSTQIFIDVLRDLQRICSHLTAVAYPVLERHKKD
ncbi:Na/Pi cotransporter family protein [Salinispirillum sp. LH 10-3-1]|uniref:Na/Pi cotransporter family protein n=1 Tax=Salinispirillum sp. LH 10-3-1 TaxID=2952525 RepID=A0AB38YGI9_9GAMM